MIRRTMLSYMRAQEEAADRAGVKFLNATQQSAKGMYETFKRFADDQLVISSRIDPYQQSHPMPRERDGAPGRPDQDQRLLGQEGSARAAAAP